jgi:hypothetical protein
LIRRWPPIDRFALVGRSYYMIMFVLSIVAAIIAVIIAAIIQAFS